MKVVCQCKNCGSQIEENFEKVSWNVVRDRCGDIKAMYIYFGCPHCGEDQVSEEIE